MFLIGKNKKVDLRKKDIKPYLEKAVTKTAKLAEKGFKSYKEKAQYVKTELDEQFRGPWNVVVGKKFGGVVTHIPDHFMYFGVKDTFYLVYCTRNMKAGHK